MSPKDFHEMYLSELSEMRSAEAQMAEKLDALADKAKNTALSELIKSHKAMTEKHRNRLTEMLETHGAVPDVHSDGSMSALISEAEKWAAMVEDEALRDAGLIASLQRMEHYEIAVFGTLAQWAESLGHQSDARSLASILNDDKETDDRLSAIAKQLVNPVAA